jgi:hypothetical protein
MQRSSKDLFNCKNFVYKFFVDYKVFCRFNDILVSYNTFYFNFEEFDTLGYLKAWQIAKQLKEIQLQF